MLVEAQVTINGSKAAVWAAITNMENASETISGIEKIEVLEKPAKGLVGLTWREAECISGNPLHHPSTELALVRLTDTKRHYTNIRKYFY